ncbi:MAG: hypothetical protein JWM74_5707 [Myxococcaceae bacterium]|nr:hypothetical protein [Myxococcaceae bacterium]
MQSASSQFRAIARLVEHRFSINENSQARNRQVTLRFQVEGGPHDGRCFSFGPTSLTPGTKPKVRAAYFAMGWNGQGNPAQQDAMRFRRQVEITVKENRWTDDRGRPATALKVEFIDPLIKSKSPALDAQGLDDLGDFFTGAIVASDGVVDDDDDDDRQFDDDEAFRTQGAASAAAGAA